MIGYSLFKETVAERIKEFLPETYEGYRVDVEEIYKINSRKDALSLKPEGPAAGKAAPVLYLDDLYEDYLIGCDIDDILEDAADVIVTYSDYVDNPCEETDFNEMTGQIVPNLIGKEWNSDYLEKLPHTDMHDMAVIYRIMIPAPDGGFNSLVIDNRIFEKIDLTLEEMHRKSIMNMKRILPFECNGMTKEKHAMHIHPEIPDSIIFVYTHYNIYGAAYLLHDDVMRKLAKKLGSRKLYVVPASIHNISVCAAEDRYLDFLKDHLNELNMDPEEKEKRLSSYIYLYDVKKKSLEIAASCKSILSGLQ